MKKNIENKFAIKLDELNNALLNNTREFNSSELLTAAEILLEDNSIAISSDIWYKYLNLTRSLLFLIKLNNREERYRWAETSFKAIRVSDYSLLEMLNQRTYELSEKPLFSTFEGNVRNNYSYKLVKDRIAKIAFSIFKYAGQKPSVALYLDNCIEGALSDIACLSYDIFVSPLHIHFNLENLNYIFNLLKFNLVITDTPQRIELLKTLRQKINYNFTILSVCRSVEHVEPDKDIYNFENFISGGDKN